MTSGSLTSTSGATPSTDDAADSALKARHRALWALGDYPSVAAEVIADLGPELVAAAQVSAGDRVLDVAAGTGNAAIPAARTGAAVTASDLTPELLATGENAARAEGLTLDWQEADAEHLPFADATFDVGLSCVGIMFAPHHQAAADELLRVVRPGGRIALTSWTPAGFIGRLFTTMKPFAPPPPPGVSPAPLWGDEDHVRGLFGDRVQDVRADRRRLPVSRFRTPAEFREFFGTRYGPTIAVYRAQQNDAERVALDTALEDLAASDMDAGGAMEWEYLLLTARRA
ncbi:class I SAM-dependent methyltransferase [Nakamurella flava]|uniref:Class I SAM-dependent methyltransferase n=1 Tax=Nakamurella flava TaxID=2576308 RepID=A0A4U6QEF6_9ACTN|nr:class I SAM-dependent methyltransferase [Nakamurella flava]TKV58533.1 class I SAM-dependent methyltransferase [Nakamurella flava]